jgi:iron complex transport system substrate-binding protein
MSRRRFAPALGAVIAALVAGGCGEQESAEPAATPPRASGFPVTVEAANGPVEVERAPRRVVSLSPTATETLFAVGAGRQVVAVDDQSDFPPSAPRTELSGYEPNVEAIAAYRPDLVVVSDEGPRDVVAGLERLGVDVLLEPSAESLEEAYDQMVDLGTATGHPEAARRLVARTRDRLAELFRSVPREGEVTVFHELSTDLYSASSDTFIGEVYERFGLRNIADRAARAGSEYPKLSAEYVVAADPDLVVLADGECCGQTPSKAARRDGWRGIDAVQDGTVIAVSDDVASRWGPRVVDFAAAVAPAIRAAQKAG